MKHFLIKYRFGNGSEEDWHREIKRFIAAIESDPALNGRISYRCLKANNGSGDCYHLAAAEDDEAAKALQERDFFKRYTGELKRVRADRLKSCRSPSSRKRRFDPRSRTPRPHPIFAMSSAPARVWRPKDDHRAPDRPTHHCDIVETGQRELALQEPRLTFKISAWLRSRSPRLRNPDLFRRGKRCRQHRTSGGQFWTPIGAERSTRSDGFQLWLLFGSYKPAKGRIGAGRGSSPHGI